jgi:methylglyoxal synthase
MIRNKTIALIAHDRRKADMEEWCKYNASTLLLNKLVCTGTTGKVVEDVLIDYRQLAMEALEYIEDPQEINLVKVKSGPMGGDAQIASMVVEGRIDLCVFLIDDLYANPHEADILMLLRQCRIHNIPVACNRHSADLMITSELWGTDYSPSDPKYLKFIR